MKETDLKRDIFYLNTEYVLLVYKMEFFKGKNNVGNNIKRKKYNF